MTETKYQRFQSTRQGRDLLKKHALNEHGIWKISGEDPNCDFGGSHHQPDLGIYEGKLSDVMTIVVELPGFWTWGAGGNIDKIKLIKVNNI